MTTPQDATAPEAVATSVEVGLEPSRATDAAGLDTGMKRATTLSSPELVAATVAGVAASAVLVSGIAVMATM